MDYSEGSPGGGSPGGAAGRGGHHRAGSDPWWHEATADKEESAPSGPSTEALIGAAAEEFFKFAGDLAKWGSNSSLGHRVRSWAGSASDILNADIQSDPQLCKSCPVCQTIVVLRTTRPQLAENLADAMDAVTELMLTVLEAVADSGASNDGDTEFGRT